MTDPLLDGFEADLAGTLDRHLNRKLKPARHIAFAMVVYVRGGNGPGHYELVTNDNAMDAAHAMRTWLDRKGDA